MQKVRRHPPPPEREGRAPTARGHPVSGSVSPRSSRCFSPFPHGTGSLSVAKEYLGLEGGPPAFGQGSTCPALLEDRREALARTGLSPALARRSSRFRFAPLGRWPGPRSLAATDGVSPPGPRAGGFC